MKKINKIITASLGLTTLFATASVLTSCGEYGNLKTVSLGDGSIFAKDDISGITVTSKDQATSALTTKDGFKAFKDQYASQLLYNWYEKIVIDKTEQTFTDKWNQWKKDVDEAYKNKISEAKAAHKNTWKYYFQNLVLDPVGGTETSWKYNEMCSKVVDEAKSLFFAHDYLQYSADAEAEDTKKVYSQITSTSKETLLDSSKWKNIDFYASANTNYVDGDLDDIYALAQKRAFDLYTARKHPMSTSMCLWKYSAPVGGGMSDVYSSIMDVPEPPKPDSNNKETTASNAITPTYTTPAFAKADGSSTVSANTKFHLLLRDVLNKNKDFAIDKNGVIDIPFENSKYTDDSSTTILVEGSTAFSTLDPTYAGAAVGLASSFYPSGTTGMSINNTFIKTDATSLVTNSPIETDLLSTFLYRSKDNRTTDASGINEFGSEIINSPYTIDLSKQYTSFGTPTTTALVSGDFHSSVFQSNKATPYDYYGSSLFENQGGVQFLTSAHSLADGNAGDSPVLPYILLRDTFGVHLIGIDGMVARNGTSWGDGFLKLAKSNQNNDTEPLSQARQNLLLKNRSFQQTMFSGADKSLVLTQKIKDFFNENMSDIIIGMAEAKTEHGKKNDDPKQIIFDDKGIVSDPAALYSLIGLGNKNFLYQSSVQAFDEATTKMFTEKYTNSKNALISRSTSFSKQNPDAYKNGLASPMPFHVLPSDDGKLFNATLSYDVCKIITWLNPGNNLDPKLNDDIWKSAESSGLTFDTVNNAKEDFKLAIAEVVKNINFKPITGDTQTFSEHIYPNWDVKNVVPNAVYKSMVVFSNSDAYSKSIKIKAMQKYAVDLVNAPDEQTGFATARNPQLQKAINSMYYSGKVISDAKPMSFYKHMDSVEDYNGFLQKSYEQILQKSFWEENNKELSDYWTFLDTLQYLIQTKDGIEFDNLLNYIKNNVVNFGDVADLVWLMEDKTDCNPTFDKGITAETPDDIYSFNSNSNYMGNFDNTYLSPDASATHASPTSYQDFKSYYQYAPIPGGGSGWNNGFAGLISNASSTSSDITQDLKNAMFNDTCYTTMKDNKNIGGWYKYHQYEGGDSSLISLINSKSTIKDIQDLVADLKKPLLDNQTFLDKVSSIVERKIFIDGDPELDDGHAVNTPISAEILKDRLLGTKPIYQDIRFQWGLDSFKKTDSEAIERMFKGANKKNDVSSLQLFSGSIKKDSKLVSVNQKDLPYSYAKATVVQLNSADLSSFDSFKNAVVGDTGNEDVARQLMYSIAAQFALSSNQQNQALTDVVKEVFGGKKIQIFDRTFNDQLGQTWVRDWKPTN